LLKNQLPFNATGDVAPAPAPFNWTKLEHDIAVSIERDKALVIEQKVIGWNSFFVLVHHWLVFGDSSLVDNYRLLCVCVHWRVFGGDWYWLVIAVFLCVC
jgi:hypothetical protein